MQEIFQFKKYKPGHDISNNVAFVKCRHRRACAASFLSLETSNAVWSVVYHS